MGQHIEIEFKNLLTFGEFERMKKYFHLAEADFVSQQNHYFDTPDFDLKNQQAALRIRQRNGIYELTLKQPAEIGLLETNLGLDAAQADEILNGNGTVLPDSEITRVLQSININPSRLRLFGTLKTSRAEFEYKSGLLVLDHSSYLNQEDFEVEYEVTKKDEGQAIFLNLLNTLQIPARQTENKIRRFFRAKFGR
ncbi:CYTH domain-containing protein [Peribacillus glennii]|uniref:CYTH domain-containing protein n=1 Tax=Peribacillus glennii TaxID=2303991 RepID=A0A372LDQ4_9BACI|nr:CYTH domain-containing protein [Peribacillus glennii]RFU64116.1 CYTH domain-containing protein [Peribacillus glennii]